MAGSPTYTADTVLNATQGSNVEMTGNVTVANSSATVRGKGTKFTTELNEEWFILMPYKSWGKLTNDPPQLSPIHLCPLELPLS